MAGGSKSKTKGARGEREICDKLGAIFGGSFIRSNNSGAYVGGKNAHRKTVLSDNQIRGVKSDIVPPDFMPRFVVESKLYAEIPYHQFFTGSPVALIDSWIDQVLDTIDDGDYWALIFRADRKPWVVLVTEESSGSFNRPAFSMTYSDSKGAKFLLFSFEDFFKLNVEEIKKATS